MSQVEKYVKDDGTIRYRDLKKLWRKRPELSKDDLWALSLYTENSARWYSERINSMQKIERRIWSETGRNSEILSFINQKGGFNE